MKLSEIEDVFNDYASAKWSPSRMHVTLGCECGCGGDSYTIDSYNAEEDAADASITKMKQLCDTLGIEYDGIAWNEWHDS